MRVKNALASVPGVRSVNVSFKEKLATVQADTCEAGPLIEAVEEVGYSATVHEG